MGPLLFSATGSTISLSGPDVNFSLSYPTTRNGFQPVLTPHPRPGKDLGWGQGVAHLLSSEGGRVKMKVILASGMKDCGFVGFSPDSGVTNRRTRILDPNDHEKRQCR